LLNLLLLTSAIGAGWLLRQKYQAAHAHQAQVLKQRVPVAPPPTLSPIPPPQPATSANYVDVAQKMLFARDRNPNVIVEPPAPAAKKVMPALPFAYGVMDFGAGPTVIMAEKAGAAHHQYHPGETVGAFKILDVNSQQILLEWEGERMIKNLSELVDKTGGAAAAEVAQKTAEAPKAAAAPAAVAPVDPKPGASMGAEQKACLAGDKSPAGTVVDGFKKVVSASPFGSRCYWEPVK
jgi:hypothetical protein